MRPTPNRRRPAGFTLVEMGVVVIIIGIIIALILVAAAAGVRQAQDQATRALITKLDAAMTDRISLLMSQQAPVNLAHQYLASIQIPNAPPPSFTYQGFGVAGLQGQQRAMVIARFDYIKAELPDVFFIQNDTHYPINFVSQPYPGTGISVSGIQPPYSNYILPLGNSVYYNPTGGANVPVGDWTGNAIVPNPYNANPIPRPNLNPTGTGIFGASYTAAAGLYKNMGNVPQEYMLNGGVGMTPFLPTGYDGLDNNGNGLIDDWNEGVNAGNQAAVAQSLLNHTHKTARSEMLYAILVEGKSPLGSVFTRDDFTDREVQDTDHDGLPEFVDAWGEPIQFYRWPIYFPSLSQKGYLPYNGYGEYRQIDPLDPAQQLVAPAWWAQFVSGGTSQQMSQNATLFQNYFHSLVDPIATGGNGVEWDRSGYYQRRSYFSKFLIVSSGEDKQLGLPLLNVNYTDQSGGYVVDGSGGPVSVNPNNHNQVFPSTPGNTDQTSIALTLIEDQAAPADAWARSQTSYPYQGLVANGTTQFLQNAGQDDIHNQKPLTSGGGLQ